MNKKRITLLIIVALAFSAFPITLFSFVRAQPVSALPDYEPMDFNPEGKSIELNTEIIGDAGLQASGLKTSAGEGDWGVWIWYDDTVGIYLAWYQLVSQGDFCEVWVMVGDLDFPGEDDPRNPVIVTQEQCDYIVEEFDNNIYPVTTEYFGDENFHDGSNAALSYDYYDEAGRTVILISNIGDDNYYDHEYPSYIAGFYWGSVFELYTDRNVISIDAYDWAHRCGTPENPWFEDDDKARPNLYESIVAHEYQHLIHDDWFELSETWMNEACSLFAEPLCGYELDLGQVEWFLATPDNSLTVWGDQGGINILADYGAAFLWALFLTDHYGIDFMSRYVRQGIAGIEGINRLLPRGYNFEKVFRDWRIANLLQQDHGKYGYSLNKLSKLYNPGAEINWDELEPLKIHEVSGPNVPLTSAVDAFGETWTIGTDLVPGGYATGVTELGEYGTDYIMFSNFDDDAKFSFDGVDGAFYGWTYDEYWSEWWSGAQNLADFLLTTESYTVQAGDMLSVPSWYDIEDDWDFGFVQYSTDGGDTWTSMENEWTTYAHHPDAHPDIVAQLPGITGNTLGGYRDLQFNLDALVGTEVMFGFRYMTDWNTLHSGWYIVGAYVGETSLELTPGFAEVDFTVDLVFFEEVDGELKFSGINKVKLNDLTEFGTKCLELDDDEFCVAVVSGNRFADYQFSMMEA